MRGAYRQAILDKFMNSSRALLGFWMCVALVVGNSIGSGVFLLPASLAPYGLNSVIAWGFTASGAIALAIVFARLSRAFPQAGGPYAYVHVAFGPLISFVVAWGYWISIWVGNVSIATAGVSYLSPLFPWIAYQPGASAFMTLLLLWLLTFVNWYGIKASGWVQGVTTVLKILPLLAVGALGLLSLHSRSAVATTTIPLSVSGVTAAATLTLWALLGLESATIPADKVASPGRTIPIATLLGTVITALIGAGKLVAVFAAISAFGALNGWILLQGELPRAMAIRGEFPQIFARESVHNTPGFGLCFGSMLATILILANYQKSMVSVFTFMILLSTTACLVLYALCSLALLRLQWTRQLGAARSGSIALGIVGILATAYSLWAIVGAGREAVLWGAALLLLGVPLYYWFRRAR